MTSRSDVLDTFRAAYLEGLRIELNAEGLPTVKDGIPSPDLLVHLKEHRESIIALVLEHGSRYVTPPGCIAERACRRLGWCTQSLMHRSCSRVVLDAESEGVLT